MRLTTLLSVALSTLANAASFLTSIENPLVPIEGVLVAGKPTTIKWTPTTTGPITLQLRSGSAQNLDQGIVIAASIPNTGSFSWTPPADLPSKPNYAIQISNDAYPGTQVNYSPQFAISGSSSSPTSASSTTSAPSTTSASSITSASSSTIASNSTTSATRSATSATATVSKTAASTTVPGSTGAAAKLGQGFAVVVGVGAFVAGL